jgi:uncharacterized protein
VKAALATLALLLATLTAHAAPTQEHPLDDAANVIPAADEAALETELRELRAAGVDLAVIIVNSTAGQSIEAYAKKSAAAWATGTTPAAVFVLAIRDRKSRLEVSDPLRDKFPDARAQSILDNIKGYLRSRDYTGAVRAVITEVKNGFGGIAPDTESPHPQVDDPTAVVAPVVVDAPVQPVYEPPPRKKDRTVLIVVAFGGAILLFAAFMWARSRISQRATFTANGVIQSDRPLWMETLWCVLLIFGGIIYVIGIILASTSSTRNGYSTSSSSWSSSSGGSSFSGSSSSSSSSSGGGWSGGGASSSW